MNSLISAHQKPKGFTLVEVLVVSVIIAILTSVVIPSYFGFVKAQKVQSIKALAQTAAVNANVMSRKGVAITASNVKASLYLPTPGDYTLTVNTDTRSVTLSDAADATITSIVIY